MDDNKDILEVFSAYLEDDYNVVTFDQPLEALKYLEFFPCSLLILDVFMPEIDGLKIIEQLKEKEFKTPIMVCSGGGDSGSLVGGLAIDQALTLGAVEGLMKPFDEEQLKRKLKYILEQ